MIQILSKSLRIDIIRSQRLLNHQISESHPPFRTRSTMVLVGDFFISPMKSRGFLVKSSSLLDEDGGGECRGLALRDFDLGTTELPEVGRGEKPWGNSVGAMVFTYIYMYYK